MRLLALILLLASCATVPRAQAPQSGCLPPIDAYAGAPPRHLSNEMGVTFKLAQ